MRTIAVGQEYACALDYVRDHKDLFETQLFVSGDIYANLFHSAEATFISPTVTQFRLQPTGKKSSKLIELTYSPSYRAYAVSRLEFLESTHNYIPPTEGEAVKLV